MSGASCRTCIRWAARPPPSRYGRCAKVRNGPQPYWFGTVTTHDQLDTADIHGADCSAYKP